MVGPSDVSAAYTHTPYFNLSLVRRASDPGFERRVSSPRNDTVRLLVHASVRVPHDRGTGDDHETGEILRPVPMWVSRVRASHTRNDE